jgi:hypothetical protein
MKGGGRKKRSDAGATRGPNQKKRSDAGTTRGPNKKKRDFKAKKLKRDLKKELLAIN